MARLRGIIWSAVSTTSQADEEEKASMLNQEADLRAFFEKEGIEIVDVLRVPGHSRNYKSLDKLAEHARKEGIDAFDKLIQHLEAADFDVIGVRDANRFARRASLLHFIAESIVEDCGAKIYSLNDGWVDSSNVDVWAMVKGYETNKQRKWISTEMNRAKDKLAEKGLPENSGVLWSHDLIRDPKTGKAIAMVVNEERRPLLNDMATLLLQGVAWTQLGVELYRQFGHVSRRDGKPINPSSLYEIIYSPTFWGHRARHVKGKTNSFGAWVFDEHVPPPPGITIHRNVLPAVYTGELAEAIKAELRRRMNIRGRARPATTYRYSRLFVCGHCGYNMSIHISHGKYYGVRCVVNARYSRGELICNQTKYTKGKHLDEVINSILVDLMEGRIPVLLQSQEPLLPDISAITSEIQSLDRKIDTLIYEQSQQTADTQLYYRRSIAQMAERLEILKSQLADTTRKRAAQEDLQAQQRHAIEAIREMTLDTFWKLPEREINQFLHRIIYNKRLVIRDCKVVGSQDY